MITAIEVARFLVSLSSKETELDPVTHMQVQKLVYYVEAWSLAINDVSMFADRIEAWRYGPVIPNLYREFKQFDDASIPASAGNESPPLSGGECDFVRRVWEGHKRFSAVGLSEMTHRESPWIDAYDPAGVDGRCRKEITRTAMQSYFKQRHDRHRLPGIDPARAYAQFLHEMDGTWHLCTVLFQYMPNESESPILSIGREESDGRPLFLGDDEP